MTWTEITETDFKLSFVLSVVQNEDASDEAEASSSNPSCLSVSSALSLICVLICVVWKQNKQLPFCPFHSDVPCKKKSKHGFFHLRVYLCVLRVTFWLTSAVPAGSEGRRRSREEDEEEALKKKQLQEEQLSKVGEKCL